MASLRFTMVKILLLYLMTGCCYGNDEVCMASIGVGTCPPTWIQWKDKCFKATKEKLPWLEAHQECTKMGGVMATPNSTDDTQRLLSITHNEHFWIDCNDLVNNGVWECKEGETDIYYRDWAENEPNNEADNEDCAKYATARNGWNDVPCSALQLTVCKKPVPSQLHF